MTQAGIVAITGMHRSGTSLATRIMQIAGLSLGGDEGIAPPGRDNPAGYWENRYVTELNDEILAALGGSWDQPPVLDRRLAARPRTRSLPRPGCRSSSIATTHRRWPRVTWSGCKDPRLSILLPVLAYRRRHPHDHRAGPAARPRSPPRCTARNAMEAPQASLLWMRYVIESMRNDPSHLLLTQDALLRRPASDPRPHHRPPRRASGRSGAARRRPDRPPRPGAPPPPGRRPLTAADPNPLVAMAEAMWHDGKIDLASAAPDRARRASVRAGSARRSTPRRSPSPGPRSSSSRRPFARRTDTNGPRRRTSRSHRRREPHPARGLGHRPARPLPGSSTSSRLRPPFVGAVLAPLTPLAPGASYRTVAEHLALRPLDGGAAASRPAARCRRAPRLDRELDPTWRHAGRRPGRQPAPASTIRPRSTGTC